MATDSKIRYVRCPKCSKVLKEFADVLVYKCGSCATVLQAKHYKATRENGASGSVHVEPSDSPISNGSADNVTCFKGKEVASSLSAYVLEATHTADDSANSNCNFSCLSGELDCHQRGEFPVTEENGIKEEVSNIGQLESTSDAECTSDNSTKLSRQTSENLILTEKSVEYPKSSGIEGDEGREEGSDADLSASRCDKEHSFKGQQDESILSNSSVSGSVETEEKEGESTFGDNELGDSLKSSRIRHTTNRFGLNTEGPSSRGKHVQQRGTSLDSSNFYSVQDWLGYKSPSKALSKGSTFHGDSFRLGSGSDYTTFKRLERDRLELLKTVDELRDQLSEVYCQRGGERKSHIRRDPSLLNPKSGQQLPHPNLIWHPQAQGTNYQRTTSVRQQYPYQQTPLLVQSCCSFSDCSLEDHLPVRPNFHHKDLCRTCSHCPTGKTHDLKLAKLQQKEKTQPSKRYCRPLSGGAPFVICYNCLKVLQLPAYFCISRRKLLKLQCGACFEVLLFSFLSGATTMNQTPIQIFHPANEFDSSASASTGRGMSASFVDDSPLGDTLSFTEESRLSFSRSFSTEAETSLHVSKRSFGERNGKIAPSSLHQLMGYYSATEILYQPSDNSEGYESAGPTRLTSYAPSEVSQVGE